MDMSVNAIYTDKVLPEFRGNPLVEALPDLWTDAELMTLLEREPLYDENDRLLKSELRIDMTERLYDFHQPMPQDIDVAHRLFRCIRWGYVNRNPLHAQYAMNTSELYYAAKERKEIRKNTCHPNVSGFTIIGISGVGKTTTIEGILSLLPQLIVHTNYKDVPLNLSQVVWLKIDCAFDGSIKGVCSSFFRALDRVLGTNYAPMYTGHRKTADTMMILMAELASLYNVGLLVIDEVQHLSTMKSGGSEKMLNFFVTLVNTLGIPVVLVGTPKALPILQSEFRQARRGSGQGDLLWDRMKNDLMWKMFVQSMWKYQYTQNSVSLSEEMSDALYGESGGIPFLAVALYKLVQEDAISLQKEIFDDSDIHRVASEKLRLTEPMRQALYKGDIKDLYNYPDIRPFTSKNWQAAEPFSENNIEDVPIPDKTVSVRDCAIKTLLGMDVCYQEAMRLVNKAVSILGKTVDEKKVAAKAYQIHLQESTASIENDSDDLRNCTGYGELFDSGKTENCGK